MTVELTMLLYSVILLLVLILIPAGESIIRNGALAQAGPRDKLPEPTVFNKRATRLKNNMIENMVLFTPIVLLASLTGVSTGNTVLGAQIFFFARIVHAVIYLAGWPMVRPVAWMVSLVGIVMIGFALL